MSASAGAERTVVVDLGDRSYPIYIGTGLLDPVGPLVQHLQGSQVAVVTNEVVAPLLLDRLTRCLSVTNAQVDVFELPDGEAEKTLANYTRILDFLIEHRHNRSTTLIALGGGVVGDITGFAAATYQRGVRFIQIPTTLLAQVDSSVGGKTAVNHPSGKNLVGAFHQPVAVLADVDVLDTLPPRELRAGIAEVVKYGAIADAGFFDWLEANAEALLEREREPLVHAISRSCEIKARIVAADERESGVRALLNFGHTFGHALEAVTGYTQLLHGEAVAIGMVMASDLSVRQGLLSRPAAFRIRELLRGFGLPVAPPAIPAAALETAMGMDKKVQDGRLRLVLLKGIGDALVTDDVDTAALRQTLGAGGALCDD